MVAGAYHAAMNLVGGIGFLVGALHGGVGIAPHAVPIEKRHLLIAGHLKGQFGRWHERERAHRRQHGARTGLFGPTVRGTALAARRVDSAHHRASRHDGAAILRRVARMLHAQAVVDAAVGNARIVSRCPFHHRVLDELRIHARDL